uniref:Uncharacterized protein n=1 Tax=Panagrolaimus davidi TaxID=227884 RepID=A0A914PAM0_9BILA
MSTEEAGSMSESLILQNQCSPSSIISKILKNSENEKFVDENKRGKTDSLLQNYKTLMDESLRIIYIEAEVHFSSLDNGYDPNESGIANAKIFGEPGDIPMNFISKKLGGDGEYRHVYPAHPIVDFGKSEIHQNLVYNHVKKGGDRFAKLFFGVIYEEEIEGKNEGEDDGEEEIDSEDEDYDENYDINYFRPKEIVYKFELYENDKVGGELLEGKFINMLP